MKKFLFLNLVFVFAAFVNAQTVVDQQFKITGHVQNRDRGTVRLFQFNDTDFKNQFTQVVNGNFSFEGIRKLPEHFGIEYIEPGSQSKNTFESFKFFIEPTAKVNIVLFPDSISKSLIKGSKIAEEYSIVNKRIEIDFKAEEVRLTKKYEKAKKEANTELEKVISQNFDSLNNQNTKWKSNFINDHPKSYISAYLVNSICHRSDIATVRKYYNKLDKSVLGSRYSLQVKNFLLTAPGSKFQDFELTDSNNKPHRFSEIAKGKVVLIDFWATWCKACREQNAKLAEIYDSYKGKGFEIVGVSGDKDISIFRNTITKDKMTWINLIDRNDEKSVTGILYTPSRLPSNVLIDRNGIITHKDIELSELEKTIENLLK